MLRFRVSVKDREVISAIESLPKRLASVIGKEIRVQSLLLTQYIKTRHLTGGTTEDRLRVRTGHLRRSAAPIRVSTTDTIISGGTEVGASDIPYAKVQIGPGGQRTIIRPKKAKFLAVPLRAALTNAGVVKYPSPRDYPGLFPIWINGKLFLVKKSGVKLYGRRVSGLIIPYFILLRQVTVRARVHPEAILKVNEDKIVKALSDAVKSVI